MKAKTGIRLDTNTLRKRLLKLRETATADSFRPELLQFAKATLETCIDTTPVRDESLISNNQQEQYENRVNYIESIHWGSADPRLIVYPEGPRLFSGGRWYRPDEHRLPDSAWNDYQALEAERQRRLEKSQREFVHDRKQARFLYQRSWVQVAKSIGLSLRNATAQIVNSHNRRQPYKEPRKASAQIRGGSRVISIPVSNPFLEEQSRYKPFTGRAILTRAIAQHKPLFMRNVTAKIRRLIFAAKTS